MELKGRVWDKKENKMYDWDTLEKSKIFALAPDLKYKENFIVIPTDEYTVWLQFIGLKDKNDKEIYEGDILKDGESIREVIKVPGGFILTGTNWDYFTSYTKNMEIIGNKFMNPEYLKED